MELSNKFQIVAWPGGEYFFRTRKRYGTLIIHMLSWKFELRMRVDLTFGVANLFRESTRASHARNSANERT